MALRKKKRARKAPGVAIAVMPTYGETIRSLKKKGKLTKKKAAMRRRRKGM